MEYIRIPRSLIYNKELGDKRVLSYSSLLFHCWDEKRCDIPELLSFCGFSDNRHSYAVSSEFAELFQKFDLAKYINIKSKTKNYFTFFSEPPKRSFGIIYKNEFAQILEYRKIQKENRVRINHSHLVLILSYIRLNMERQPGKPVIHFSMLKTIAENVGISPRSVTTAINILESLSIIHHEPLPRYRDEDGNWHTNIKIFVNIGNVNNVTGYDWQQETQRAINYLLASQRQFTGG